MKGVSAVIAIILILMITVALAATAYVWFTSVFQTITGSAGERIGGVGTALGTSFSIESATNVSSNNVSISIRNTGSENIDMTKVEAYVNEVIVSEYYGKTGTMTSGTVKTFYATVSNPCNKALRVTEATGTSQTTTIVCS